MAITKRKNQDEHEKEPGSGKRSRMVSGEDEGQSKQRNFQNAGKSMPIGSEQSGALSRDNGRTSTGLNQEMDEWESGKSKLIEEEPDGYAIPFKLADSDQWSVMLSREAPDVNAIYRRDIASFLPREKVEEWRLTSQFSDAALSEFPSKLPRRRYCSLEIATWSGERKVREHGYVEGSRLMAGGWGYGKVFQQISGFRRCCGGLEASAQALAGELVFPRKPESEVVIFRITPYHSMTPRQPSLRILNRLTAATAFDFLHFVWHASKECYYDWVGINFGKLSSAEEVALNPAVLQRIQKDFALKKPFRFHALYTSFGAIKWSAETMEAALQLVKFKSLRYALYLPSWAEYLPRLLQHLGERGRLHSKAVVDCCTGYSNDIGFIDAVVKHFQERRDGLASAISDINFVIRHWFCYSPYLEDYADSESYLVGWPAICSEMETISQSAGSVYVYQFQNRFTKEGFKLTLHGYRYVAGSRVVSGMSGVCLTVD